MTNRRDIENISPEELDRITKVGNLESAISSRRRKLLRKLNSDKPKNLKEIICILEDSAEKCINKIELGATFNSEKFGKNSAWYSACHLLYAEGLSNKVPQFFKERIPVPSQSTAGASSQGRRNTLFGELRLTDPEILALVTRPPMPPTPKVEIPSRGRPSKRGRRTLNG